jgi:hypothetical protein
LIGGKGIRCDPPLQRRVKAGAAPATVGGESFFRLPLGLCSRPGKVEKGGDPRARRPA